MPFQRAARSYVNLPVNRLTFPDIYGIRYSRISETDGVSLVAITGSVRAGARRPQRNPLTGYYRRTQTEELKQDQDAKTE